MKKQQITTTKTPMNISICPDELKPLLKLVNFLPDDLELLKNKLTELLLQWNAEFYGAKSPLTEIIVGLEKKYCEKLRLTIAPQSDNKIKDEITHKSFQNGLFFVRLLINEKIALKFIIQSFRVWDNEYNRQIASPIFNFEKSISGFCFNADTTLELQNFRVVEILKKNNIPIERVRVCPVCKKIFWAKRTESPACSPEHVHAFNARIARIGAAKKNYYEQLEKQKKLESKYKTGEHPLVLEQQKKISKLFEKIQRMIKKNGTL